MAAANKKGSSTGDDKSGARERILRATLKLISEEGMPAVSNRRVAAEAGVSLGSLTYHFPSQVELLNESLTLLVDETAERIKGLSVDIRGSGMSIEKVAEGTAVVIEQSGMVDRLLAEMELHLQSARQKELRAASIRCFEAYDELATATLEMLGVERAKERAPIVVAFLVGVAVRQLGTGQRDATAVSAGLKAMAAGVGAIPARRND